MPGVFFLGISFWFFTILLFLFLLIVRRFIQINLVYDFRQFYARKLMKRSKKFSEHYQLSIDVLEDQFLNLCSIFLFLFFVMLFFVFIN